MVAQARFPTVFFLFHVFFSVKDWILLPVCMSILTDKWGILQAIGELTLSLFLPLVATFSLLYVLYKYIYSAGHNGEKTKVSTPLSSSPTDFSVLHLS